VETGSVCFASERRQDAGLVADKVEGRGWRAMLAVCIRSLAPYSALTPVYHIDRPASTTPYCTWCIQVSGKSFCGDVPTSPQPSAGALTAPDPTNLVRCAPGRTAQGFQDVPTSFERAWHHILDMNEGKSVNLLNCLWRRISRVLNSHRKRHATILQASSNGA
jgi:hypothetical protein